MSDYTQNTTFTPKDSLSAGDPDKLILGAELDPEFSEIQTAIATKYDSTDIASQVQAEAGTSNAVLMTPLRVAQLITGSGSSGAVDDIAALDDPGADRILFWDDSASAVTWLTVGTGLSISGTTIASDDANVDHDALTNYVADEHVAHAGVTLTAGVGLTGGGTIAASRTFDMDVDGLTAETTIDGAADYMVMYDASAAGHVKVLADNLVGDALGDGKWYRATAQSITSTEADVVFSTEDYDSLTRGTFSTGTGKYTAGADGARIWIHAQVGLVSVSEGDEGVLVIEVGTTEVARDDNPHRGKSGVGDTTLQCGTVLNLSASDVVTVRASNQSTKNSQTGVGGCFVSIMEIG